jgi:hypothetical protein
MTHNVPDYDESGDELLRRGKGLGRSLSGSHAEGGQTRAEIGGRDRRLDRILLDEPFDN